MLDRVGAVASIVKYNNRIDERTLRVLGRNITREPPVYMNVIAVAFALRVAREFMSKREIPQEELFQPAVYAGNAETVYLLKSWYETGALKLESAAAPEIIEAWEETEKWLTTKIIIRSQVMPDITEEMSELPAICKDVMTLAGEFRTQAIPRLGGRRWMSKLPRIQLTKVELKQHIHRYMEEDESWPIWDQNRQH